MVISHVRNTGDERGPRERFSCLTTLGICAEGSFINRRPENARGVVRGKSGAGVLDAELIVRARFVAPYDVAHGVDWRRGRHVVPPGIQRGGHSSGECGNGTGYKRVSCRNAREQIVLHEEFIRKRPRSTTSAAALARG